MPSRLKEHQRGRVNNGRLARLGEEILIDDHAHRWDLFMERGRSRAELLEEVFLNPDADDEVAFRCMEVLLSLEPSKLPYRVKVAGAMEGFEVGYNRRWREQLPPGRAAWAALLLAYNINRGRALWRDGDEARKLAAKLDNLNEIIIKILPLLYEDQALKLMDSFNINDYMLWRNFEDSSGYTPLRNLVLDKKVPESCKKYALSVMMQDRVRAEVSGLFSPRTNHEDAWTRFGEIVALMARTKAVGDDVVEDQVRFMVSRDPNRAILPYGMVYFTDVLACVKSETMRLLLVRRVTLPFGKVDEGDLFSVDDSEDLQIAEALLAEFGYDDEVSARLRLLIKRFMQRGTFWDHDHFSGLSFA